MPRYLQIDEEGYVVLDGQGIEDADVGRELLSKLRRVEQDRFVTDWDGEVLVEAFDEPIVARHVERKGSEWLLQAPYGLRLPFDPKKLCVDEWDRFHGLTSNEVSFVFSRSAQFEFFNLVDSYSDEGVTIDGEFIVVPEYALAPEGVATPEFWNERYVRGETGWEIGQPAQPLKDVLAQLKLPKSRVLVLGCGSGRDAAYFAENGHIVTAVDFSEQAINKARAQFENVPHLEFVQSDIFKFQPKGKFDLIFEHACYACFLPEKRRRLVQLWRQWLEPKGHLLAIFFVMARRGGPPFGNSEWELRERLKKSFRFEYWTRWRNSIPHRLGRELVVYAERLE